VQSSIISSRVTGAFIAVMVILVLAYVASVHGASRLADLDLAVTRARNVLEEVSVTGATLHEVESARRGYFRTHQKPILELYLLATKDAVAHLDRLRELTSGDPAQRRRVDAIRLLVAQQLTLVTDAIVPRSPQLPDTHAEPPAADEGTILTEQIRGLVVELGADARASLHDRDAEANARTVKVIRGFGAVALIALLLLGGAYYLLDRDAAVHDAVLEELRSYTRPATAGSSSPEHASAPPDAGG
jgi:methyl-accepting chemotaxis protein